MKTRIAIPRLIAITLLTLAAVTLLWIAAAKHGALVPFPSVQQKTRGQKQPAVQLSGDKARDYLEQTSDGQSLRQALTAARFGLEWQEDPPVAGETGGGYLGTNHEQDLNAWFDEEGVTVRPTLPEAKRDQAWSMALRLKSYGYGEQLVDVPSIVSRTVKENRIEYVREDQASAIAHLSRRSLAKADLGSRISHPALTEWYENKAEGIEQGFTLNERPEQSSETAARAPQLRSGDALVAEEIEQGITISERAGCSRASVRRAHTAHSAVATANEPLRVLLAVTGDLKARMRDERAIELLDKEGKGALSYSKLVAVDADGKRLAARMEASGDGREIALVVEDGGARYPLVIDPVVATLEKKLEAFTAQQAEARFGAAVAIEGDRAVVGAWREDTLSGNNTLFDAGVVYVFTRSGSTWTLKSRNDGGTNAGDGCGQSVAISGSRVVYGCPGAFNNTGRAFMRDLTTSVFTELNPAAGQRATGDRYGASVAISGNKAVVGAPSTALSGKTNVGAVYNFVADSNSNFTYNGASGPSSAVQDAFFGSAVAIDGNTTIIGVPGANQAVINSPRSTLQPSDGATGDQFGQSVAISGNTAVIGAPLNSNARGTKAGAAYVFVRDTSGNWTQQQKLTANDGVANDFFSVSAVAIQGNTIVIGAYGWEPTAVDSDENGKAYVFMRSGTVWTQQAVMVGDTDGSGAGFRDQFGIGVGISGNSVIAGARAATASGVARSGAAYVYRLDCVPPYGTEVLVSVGAVPPSKGNATTCPGTTVQFVPANFQAISPAFQWRKNGINIPGATSTNYTITATAGDTGSYDVIVSTSCGSDISSAVILTVQSFSLNPTSQNFGVSGSNGVVNVTATGSSCSWTAVSNSSFITVNSGSSGTGNGTVGFTVAANPNSGQRTGTITIAGLTFNVSQDGTNCSYSIAPSSQNLGPSASTNTVNVTASAGCAWTAASNDPSFLSINSGASGSGDGAVTYTIATNFDTAQRIGTLTIAGQIFTVTQDGMPTPTPTPTPAGTPATLGNISTRLRVETDDNALIGGFIITGTQPKKVIIRAIGPSLPFADHLANPTLELRNSAGDLLDSNDDWQQSPNKQAIIDSTIPPADDLESAIVATLPANSSGYTAIVRGVNNGTGIGVVEAYDLDRSVDSKLANISTRGFVSTGDNVLIAGTIVLGEAAQKVIVRAIGPSLSVAGKLADPTLELRDRNGALLEANDNWVDSPNKQAIIDSTIPPANDLESAIVATLPANSASYTAIVRGVGGTTGIAVVEVYGLQ